MHSRAHKTHNKDYMLKPVTHSLPSPTSSAEELYAQANAIFTSIGDGAIATDEFGKITRINPKALNILGFESHEVLGKWFPKKIIAVDERGKQLNLIDRSITRAFLTGEPVSDKMFYKKKNGEIIPVAVTVSPIILNDRPVGAIEVFRDITLENEIDRMKSEFISLASHQLRTPLSAIKTYSHMLIDGYMGEITVPQKKSLRTIISAANRMNELISTLLNITRIESGSIAVTPKMLNLNRLLEEVVKDLQLPAQDKTITLECTTPVKACLYRTDSLITKEILSNLISNAIKYTSDQGRVSVTLKSTKSAILFTIQDTGMGIPEEAHEQVFTKFFRAQNVVRQETSGTGLGLYLVKGLVDTLGGKIWFESQENRGTTFYVSFPKAAPRNRKQEQ